MNTIRIRMSISTTINIIVIKNIVYIVRFQIKYIVLNNIMCSLYILKGISNQNLQNLLFSSHSFFGELKTLTATFELVVLHVFKAIPACGFCLFLSFFKYLLTFGLSIFFLLRFLLEILCFVPTRITN
jgi:hypothetical protein